MQYTANASAAEISVAIAYQQRMQYDSLDRSAVAQYSVYRLQRIRTDFDVNWRDFSFAVVRRRRRTALGWFHKHYHSV